MATLKDILKEEVQEYVGSGRGANLLLFPLADPEFRVYGVVVDYPKRQYRTDILILARMVGDKIIIEEDNTNKPLLAALLQRGVPRDQIVLAYQNEVIPEELEWFMLKREQRPT
jgi:hypothetical protein